jgi:O-antigen ligase
VQWGAIGVVLLYAMWIAHWLLFRGEDLAAWIGSLVVLQNVLTSIFNSHLFDFQEGWIYVLGVGVGVAGGMVLAARRKRTDPSDQPQNCRGVCHTSLLRQVEAGMN